MHLSKVLSLVVIGCLPVVAFSLTLEEGAKSILSSSPKFKESVETYNGVLKEYNIAENGYLPTLDLVSSYGHEHVKTPSIDNSSMTDQTSLVLNQNIFNGFGTENAIKQQKIGLMLRHMVLQSERIERFWRLPMPILCF